MHRKPLKNKFIFVILALFIFFAGLTQTFAVDSTVITPTVQPTAEKITVNVLHLHYQEASTVGSWDYHTYCTQNGKLIKFFQPYLSQLDQGTRSIFAYVCQESYWNTDPQYTALQTAPSGYVKSNIPTPVYPGDHEWLSITAVKPPFVHIYVYGPSATAQYSGDQKLVSVRNALLTINNAPQDVYDYSFYIGTEGKLTQFRADQFYGTWDDPNTFATTWTSPLGNMRFEVYTRAEDAFDERGNKGMFYCRAYLLQSYEIFGQTCSIYCDKGVYRWDGSGPHLRFLLVTPDYAPMGLTRCTGD